MFQGGSNWWDLTVGTEPGYQYASLNPQYLCPDLLTLDRIGGADTLRGKVVRAFFWCMQIWPTK